MADASAGTMTPTLSINLSLVDLHPEHRAKYVGDVNGRVRAVGSMGAIGEPIRSPSLFETARDRDTPTL